MKQKKWIKKYQKHIRKNTGMRKETAIVLAKFAYDQELENCDGRMPRPEDSVEVELSYWDM